jgi:ketosteroid isomerase-like protein
MTTEEQVRATIDEWTLAVRNEDFGGVLKNHDPNIVMFDLPYPLQSKGIDEYKKTWELFFSWSKQSRVFDIVEMEIKANEHLAFCYGLMRCAGTSKESNREEFTFRLTLGLVKKNGQWLICHEHHSLPAP